MPKVPPATTPSGQVLPMVDPVFMAMAAADFVKEAKASTPKASPNGSAKPD